MTRKEARIRLISKREEFMHKYMFEEAEVLTVAIKALEADKPRGEWIYWRENGIKRCKCSRCLTSYGCLDTPYCPNCGTKMVGEGRDEC